MANIPLLEAISQDLDHIEARAKDYGITILAECDDNGAIFLSHIERNRDDPSSKGSGARAMEALCRTADLYQVALETSYMSDETGLKDYYARFGFVADGEPGKITNLIREPKFNAIPINGVTLNIETMRATREHFAESSRATIAEIVAGTTKVDDPEGTIAWLEDGIRSDLAGEGDHTVTFRQRALWIQTGDMPPIFSPPAQREAA